MIARYIGLGLLIGATFFGVCAQGNLAELVDEANASWMLGKWEAEIDSGKITLEFSWDLDKHVVVLHGKTPDMEFKGYTAREPGSMMEVNYYGFDNRGALSKGSWTLEGGELVLRLETRSATRNMKLGVVFGGSASEGLTLRLHGLDSSDTLVTPARAEVKFKKVK